MDGDSVPPCGLYIAAVGVVTVTYRAHATFVVRGPECFYCVNAGKVNLTSSELVGKLNGTKFDCMICSNVDVIDRMKTQKVKFSPKSGMSYSGWR